MDLLVYEKPVLYLQMTEITGVLSTIINVGTLFLMYFAAPQKMGKYRYFLLAYQSVASGMEFLLKVSMIEMFQPAPVARFHGVLQLDAKTWNIGAACFCTALSNTTGLCLVYRHRQVLPLGHWARPLHLALFFIVSYLFFTGLITYSIGCMTMEQGQGRILYNWIRDHPEFYILLTVPDIWASDFTPITIIGVMAKDLLATAIGMLLITSICVCSVLYGHAFFLLRPTAGTMSEKTRQLHRRLLLLLAVQMGIPMLTLVGPSGAMGIAAMNLWATRQVANQLFMFCIGSHGVVSSLSIVLLTDSYRQCLSGLFRIGISSTVGAAGPERRSILMNKIVVLQRLSHRASINFANRVSNHLFIFAVGSHGMVSSFSIVLLTDSYRQCLTGIFGGRKSSVVIGVVVEKASLSINKVVCIRRVGNRLSINLANK